MPLYMDIHNIAGVSADEVADAHLRDHQLQEKYGVNYFKYWFNKDAGKLFCICEAPDTDTAVRVHKEAHGHLAEKLIEIEPDMVEAFLGGGKVHSCGATLLPGDNSDTRDPAIRTILFTDIVDSTALTQSLGDEEAMDLIHLHDAIVREALKTFGGREVKHTGDGIMASFVSSAAAVKCASHVQRQMTQRQEAEKRYERPLKIRIGAAAGEPVEHHDDLFGCTVQLAARLCSHASPGQIVVSNAIADLCVGKKFSFQDLGEVSLKGFEQPVRVHAVAWQ